MLSRETLISMLKNEYPSSYDSHDVENMGVKELDDLLDFLDSMQSKANGGMMLDNTKTYHQANDYTAPPDLEIMIGYANGGGVGSMMQPKKKKFKMQGGMKNYLGKQKMVNAPKYWKSRPDKPETELAYITKAEKDLIMKSDLHGSLNPNVKGKFEPNEGPSGIISLDYQGDKGTYGKAGQSYGDRETYGKSSTPSGRPSHHPGVGPTKTSTKTVSPKDHFTQSWSGPKGLFGGGGYQNLNVAGDTSQGHKSRFGMGNILGGIMGALMGIPGFGLLTSLKDKFQGLRGYNPDGTPKTQEQWEEDRQTRINEKRISNILNRKAPITEMTQKNLSKLGYTGAMPGIGSTPTSRAINKDFELGLNTFDGPFATSHLQSIAKNLPNTKIGPSWTIQDEMVDVSNYNNTGIMKNTPSWNIGDQFLNQNPEVRNMLGINRNLNTTPVNTNTYDQNIENWRNANNVNFTNVGLNTKQKELLDQRKNMLDALGAQGILDTITSEDDPNDPATIEDVKAYYSI